MNPKYKTNVNYDNCPLEKAMRKQLSIEKRMPELCKFNSILVTLGKEPVRWVDG